MQQQLSVIRQSTTLSTSSDSFLHIPSFALSSLSRLPPSVVLSSCLPLPHTGPAGQGLSRGRLYRAARSMASWDREPNRGKGTRGGSASTRTRVEEPARAHTGSPASAMRNAAKMSREVGSWDVTILARVRAYIAYASGGVTCV